MDKKKEQDLEEESRFFHSAAFTGRAGKYEISPTKPLTTQHDLALAYSPGVAGPCRSIQADPDLAYTYTNRGNMVAVISNGTAVLGLEDIGALASKPVMEGKAVLFKRYADVDAIDLEVDTRDTEAFINAVKLLGPSFGGINLEDIAAPACFVIEEKLRELMDIPVFHDDQHGTAVIATAGMLNAMDLTKRKAATTRLVIFGAGAAGIACAELMQALGMPRDNILMCDSTGVIYRGRNQNMNAWKEKYAAQTDARTPAEAMQGADAVFGLSKKDVIKPEMVASMAPDPIVFAMSNPDPEIMPEAVKAVRDDAIVATGRSDYPNQVNNVLGFPFIFRGALDVRASTINTEMKLAAAKAIAKLARDEVPDEVADAYDGQTLSYGKGYIIPTPFDPRLIVDVPAAVAEAASQTGVARQPISDLEQYRRDLKGRMDPTDKALNLIYERVRDNQKRIVFAEGEEERVLRAALQVRDRGQGLPVLVGREDRIHEMAQKLSLPPLDGIEIHNARLSQRNTEYIDYLYARNQRHGFLKRDCQRLIHQDRNFFAATMLAMGDVDAMVTGATRSFAQSFEAIKRVIPEQAGAVPMGLVVLVVKGRTVFIADTLVHETPESEVMALFARQAAAYARKFGHEPRVAFLGATNFGARTLESTSSARGAVELLQKEGAAFEFDGEITMNVALNDALRQRLYPFCRLSGPANVLIMPSLNTAHISSRIMQELGGGTMIGPLLLGLSRPVQIVSMGADVAEIAQAASMAAYDAIEEANADAVA